MQRREIIEFLQAAKANLQANYEYTPDITCIFPPNLPPAEKEKKLWCHAEKMALGWALLTQQKTGNTTEDIYMYNNLRFCKDCHLVVKLFSHLFKRKIIVRDANRFHTFEGGECSCKDYF